MDKFIKQYKGILIIAVITIALMAYIYFKGKKAGNTVIPDAPYIEGKAGIPAGYNPNILADELYDVMDGIFTRAWTKNEAWGKLLNLPTDDMVILVYNTFNKKYGKEGKGSLTQWIKDEYNSGIVRSYKEELLARLANLRLN